MSSPVSITVPSKLTITHPGRQVTVNVPVYDSGTKALHVTVTDGAYTKAAMQHNATSWVVSESPQSFTVQPGHSEVVQVTLAVPAGAGGTYTTQLVFTGRPVDGPVTGNVQVNAAVATSIVVSVPGKATTAHAPPLVTGPPPGSFPAAPVAAGGSALLVAALATVLVTRRRRVRGAHHQTTHIARHAG